jgi:hypothetical protein
MRRIAFFEDSAATQLRPIALLRPVFELLCGHFSVRERVLRGTGATEWGALIRRGLVESYCQQQPEARINDERWLREGPTLLVNGRWLSDPHALLRLGEGDVGVIDGTVVSLLLDPDEAPLLVPDAIDDALVRIAAKRRRVPAGGRLIQYPWDLVDANRLSPAGPHVAVAELDVGSRGAGGRAGRVRRSVGRDRPVRGVGCTAGADLDRCGGADSAVHPS